jgi:hypothetical protein
VGLGGDLPSPGQPQRAKTPAQAQGLAEAALGRRDGHRARQRLNHRG